VNDKILELKKIITETDQNKLTDPSFLEKELIPSLGLNDELLHEQPTELSNFYGKGLGLKIWQYPNQFSKYLNLLNTFKENINSYLEIGCRNGGTFALTCEYLSPLSNAVAVDIIDATETIRAYTEETEWAQYKKIDSHSQEFYSFMDDNFFDLILIDGDHSYEGVKQDAEATRIQSNIQVYHDIHSDACPGVKKYWEEIKSTKAGEYNFYEFIDQYDSVVGNYLGIGVAVRKKWLHGF